MGLLPPALELGEKGLLLDIELGVNPLPLVEEVGYFAISDGLSLNPQREDMVRPEFREHLLLEVVNGIRAGLLVVVRVGTQERVGGRDSLGFGVGDLGTL